MSENLAIFKKILVLSLILLIFLSGCISEAPQATTPPPTTPTPTTTSPAEFEIIDLRIVPENPQVGDFLTIIVDVQNNKDSSGSYRGIAIIGAAKTKSQDIDLEGKSSKTVEFQKIGLLNIEGTREIRVVFYELLENKEDMGAKVGDLTKTITVKRGPFFYILQGKFTQTTEYEYEIYLESGDEKPVYINTVHIPSVSSYHFSQQVFNQSIEYSETPDSVTMKRDDSIRYERAEWNDPPPEITVTRTAECKNIVSYSPFITQSRYPLDTESLSSDVKKYLDPDPFAQSDDPEIIALAEEIVEGAESVMDAIVRVLNWVRYNVCAGTPKDPEDEGAIFADAKRTLKYREGNCVNFANLSIALLRAAGIPAKMSGGNVADFEYEGGKCGIIGHAWISAYIPEEGFIEFESSYWMPGSGLVPETILMPRHIVSISGSIGISNVASNEAHRSLTLEVTSLPEKKTYISESINKDDIISFLANAEEKGGTGVYQVSFKAVAPSGWKVFLSNKTVTIDTDRARLVLSGEVLITIIPPPDAKSGDEAEITIIADDVSKQGEIVISISIK
ncbi:MAG: hypothetical protein KAT49_00595 [Methanomicrobia archaeon]|nr:hypothetical protein [Methanomicrobia archaeon]